MHLGLQLSRALKAFVWGFAVVGAVCVAAVPGRPNFVVILADDMGYGDAGFSGGRDIPTPHLDSLAEEGGQFTAGYVTSPQCAPSRAGLLSGVLRP